MRKFAAILAAAALAMPTLALAQQNPPQQRGEGKVIAEATVEGRAVVEAVDLQQRIITLSMPDGSIQAFAVGPSVRKLSDVKPGDIVNTRYTEAVSVKLNKTPVKPGVKVESSVAADEKSVKPAGTAGVRVTTTATIAKITDNGTRLTLKMPDGNIAEVLVRDPDNRAMIQRGEVKPGDQISITYLRAVAVSVEQAPRQ